MGAYGHCPQVNSGCRPHHPIHPPGIICVSFIVFAPRITVLAEGSRWLVAGERRCSSLFFHWWKWRQRHVLRGIPAGFADEGLAILGVFVEETSMGEEELVVLAESHGAVEAILLSGAVVTEGGFGDLVPLAVGGADPLVSVEGFSQDVAVLAGEVFAEAV